MWFSKTKPQPETPFFEWSSRDHSVGVPAFDREHEHLAGIVSKVHAALKRKPDRARALELLDELIQETRNHFAHEEQALEAAGFEGLEEHAEEHSALLEEIRDMTRQFKAGSLSALSLPTFLRNWLIPHVQGSDRKYAAVLRRHRNL